jgi:transposase
MLGPPKPRRLDQPIAVSLEDLVPRDHFYRHVEARLDLSFVREWVRELYAERGRPSIDPVVFFKLQLVMFFEGIRSERKLVEIAGLNLTNRWTPGYTPREEIPGHSTVSRMKNSRVQWVVRWFTMSARRDTTWHPLQWEVRTPTLHNRRT